MFNNMLCLPEIMSRSFYSEMNHRNIHCWVKIYGIIIRGSYTVLRLNGSESVNKQALFAALKKLYFNEAHAYENCEMMYG